MTGDGQIDSPAKMHLIEQEAQALLGPIVAALGELERRTQRFVDVLNLSERDEAAIRASQAAIATARAEVDRLWRGSLER